MLRRAMHSSGIIMIQFLLNLFMLIDDEAFILLVRDGVVVVLIDDAFEHFILTPLLQCCCEDGLMRSCLYMLHHVDISRS